MRVPPATVPLPVMAPDGSSFLPRRNLDGLDSLRNPEDELPCRLMVRNDLD